MSASLRPFLCRNVWKRNSSAGRGDESAVLEPHAASKTSGAARKVFSKLCLLTVLVTKFSISLYMPYWKKVASIRPNSVRFLTFIDFYFENTKKFKNVLNFLEKNYFNWKFGPVCSKTFVARKFEFTRKQINRSFGWSACHKKIRILPRVAYPCRALCRFNS